MREEKSSIKTATRPCSLTSGTMLMKWRSGLQNTSQGSWGRSSSFKYSWDSFHFMLQDCKMLSGLSQFCPLHQWGFVVGSGNWWQHPPTFDLSHEAAGLPTWLAQRGGDGKLWPYYVWWKWCVRNESDNRLPSCTENFTTKPVCLFCFLVTNDSNPLENNNLQNISYDVSKLVDFPGFNVPAAQRTRDVSFLKYFMLTIFVFFFFHFKQSCFVFHYWFKIYLFTSITDKKYHILKHVFSPTRSSCSMVLFQCRALTWSKILQLIYPTTSLR